ncbi:MAG: PIG-L family deacetylase [Nocardioidaceae bacterium]
MPPTPRTRLPHPAPGPTPPDRPSLPDRANRPVTPASIFVDAWTHRLGTSPTVEPADALGLSRGDTVLAVVAHPDDETLAMGATLARLAADGVDVRVLVGTRGEAALDHLGVPVPGLGSRRETELRAAATALGVTEVRVVGLPDGGLGSRADDLRTAVFGALHELSVAAIATLWRADPHPDHRAAAGAALAAGEDAGIPVAELGLWSTHWTDPLAVTEQTLVVGADDASQRARAVALGCYRSQTEPLAPGLAAVLPPAVLEWPHEYVLRP